MKKSLELLGRLQHSYRVAYLIREFLQKNMSIEEEEELDKWILASEENMELFEVLTDEKNIDDFLKWYSSRDVERNLTEVKRRLRFSRFPRILLFWKYTAAACLIGVVGIFAYYLLSSKNEKVKNDLSIHATDILPGSEFAMLKMSSGKTISLKNITDTAITTGISVMHGELVYSGEQDGKPEMQELIVPRKGFYRLVLPDRTKVWVNSESSIRYPSQFGNVDRRVYVTGETYFEVAHDPSKPFIVSVNGIDVQALGTEFDVNAYSDEDALRTTLIRGSVKVQGKKREEVLKPGQQVSINNEMWSVSDVETETVSAWRDRQFKFKNASINEIMRQVQRWYDVSVSYEDKIGFHFNGTISRDVSVSHLLQLLEETGNVKFEIKGNEIIVKK